MTMKGRVSIGGRLITNFRLADYIVVNDKVKEAEADVLIDHFNTATTRYTK